MSSLLKNAFQVVSTLECPAQRIKHEVNKQFKKQNYNITYEQWEVIQSIPENVGHSQVEIAKTSHKDPASISRTLNHLSKRGILKKRIDKRDKCVNRIFLTKMGKELSEKTCSVVEEVSKNCLSNVFDRELNLFIKILDRIQNKEG